MHFIPRSRIFKATSICVVSVCLLICWAVAIGYFPVLLHITSGACACGDYHGMVSGTIILNPFRNKAPEQAAEIFLSELKDGNCSLEAALCAYALDEGRNADWRFRNRNDEAGRTQLFFKLTKIGMNDPKFRLTGEGMIDVRQIGQT